MATSIGKLSKSFFVKLLVGIIILPFVFWGMGDVFRGGNLNVIATIDSKKVTTQEFISYFKQLNLSEAQIKNLPKTAKLQVVYDIDYIIKKYKNFFYSPLEEKWMNDIKTFTLANPEVDQKHLITQLDKFDKIKQINLKKGQSTISPNKAGQFGIKIAKDGILRSSNEVLTQKVVDINKIREIWPDIPFFSKEIDEQVEINAHYRGYLKKQKADILAFKRDENLIISDKINYDGLSGLSNEVKAKFKEIKPKTMGQALRIDGITPAAVYILLSHVKRKSIKHIA